MNIIEALENLNCLVDKHNHIYVVPEQFPKPYYRQNLYDYYNQVKDMYWKLKTK